MIIKNKSAEKFYSKIKITDSCWLWNGALSPEGYGNFWTGFEHIKAHRFSYILHKGLIPEGYMILHSCDKPICVNPDHLSAGTPKENTQDCIAKGRRAEQKAQSLKITSHAELKKHIEGKTILHLMSLGKDSLVTLEWLSSFAAPKKIYSLFFKRFTVHPDEEKYWSYIKKQYASKVEFIEMIDPNELNFICEGQLQEPHKIWEFNNYELGDFSRKVILKEKKSELGIDYFCDGTAGYEGMGRAQKFHNKGLLQGDFIYPLGLMKKADIESIIRKCNLKLNPTYRHYSSTFDEINYFRMRLAMIRNPEYRKRLLTFFPMLRLDIYRWEKMING